jgi:hypothetical protein
MERNVSRSTRKSALRPAEGQRGGAAMLQHHTRGIIAIMLALLLVAFGAWWMFARAADSAPANGASGLGPDMGGWSGHGPTDRHGEGTTSTPTGSSTAGGAKAGASGHVGVTGTTGGTGTTGHGGTTTHGGSTGHGTGTITHGPGGTGTTGGTGTGGTGGTGGAGGSTPSPSSTAPVVGVTAAAGTGSGGTTVDAGATITGPGGAMTSLHVTACTAGLSGVNAKASVKWNNGYTASNVVVLGLSLKNLAHPLGLHVNVGGSSYSVPLGASVSVSLCL